MGWAWDNAIGRYRDQKTGKLLPGTAVRRLTNESLAKTTDLTADLAKVAAAGKLSPEDLSVTFKQEIKKEYIRQYLAGIGGEAQMKPADWGSIGGMLKEQYGHLDQFMADTNFGNLSEDQIRARMAMYINSAREANGRASTKVAKATDKSEEKWVLGDSEHCQGCLDFDAEGWQTIGHFPEPGAGKTVCLTSCQCHKEYR